MEGLATVVALAAENLTASAGPSSSSAASPTWTTPPSQLSSSSPFAEDVFNNITSTEPPIGKSRYSVSEIIVLAIFAGSLSIVTVVGNSMVMISFKIDKQLQTISNYFLFSLAVADLAIGLISMPLFTVSALMGYWPLGPHVCDAWLTLDYLNSNASVLNLLIISFDRYFSVTRPLTYRAKRTTNRAAIMIGCAWGISLLLWTPWIYSWPYIEGERTVPDTECYIQFIETNHYITFGTAIAAFYVPVSVMCWLYWRIWRETEKRQKDLPNLQAGKKDSSKRSNSSDEAVDLEDWRRQRSESGGPGQDDLESGYLRYEQNRQPKPRPFTWSWVRLWCVTWWHSGREDPTEDCEDTPSDMGYATPVSVETPLQSSVSRCTSLNVIRDPLRGAGDRSHHVAVNSISAMTSDGPPSRALQPASRLANRSLSTDSVGRRNPEGIPEVEGEEAASQVYTILIRLPPETCEDSAPSIKLINDDVSMSEIMEALPSDGVGLPGLPALPPIPAGRPVPDRALDRVSLSERNSDRESYYSAVRRPSHIQDVRMPLNAKSVPRQLGSTATSGSRAILSNLGGGKNKEAKKKKKTQEKKAEKKAAKTLCAILLTFILTWTPYNILVLLKPLTACTDCIPPGLWDFFYYLCYINSTINPMCYALCNASFRRTYVRILKCKWHTRTRTAMNRGFYN
ncbi:muscarinic acetylcholine receptor DM1 isoform X3 [Frankliniella occidentalis]|uniref:Muscarinic acetylcholine receptor DM1 isoform X3 n=1 Tax=Frankliniella occidentalis TaxID=133901 RepID=A0A9C6XSE0_FRAOC|nr:muscarinic acetylcholine receptor DM1 isoform X3 [Frankliniella occidentalis]